MDEDARKRKTNFVSPIKKGLFSGKNEKLEKQRPKSMEMSAAAAAAAAERRPLNDYVLAPPDYTINTQILMENYIEKEVKFLGVIPDIPSHLDSTMRTEILRIIDRGKKQEVIPWCVNSSHSAIFSLSAYNVKISRRHGDEELLLRVPIHDIAAICYIKDDATHLLGLKYGDPNSNKDMCNLVVLHCDSRTKAEELCSLIGQCFQLVYTDATMQFLDRQLADVHSGLSIGSITPQSDNSSNLPKQIDDLFDPQCHAFLTESIVDGSHLSSVSRSLRMPSRRISVGRSSETQSDLSQSATDLLHDYMKRLHTKLSADELRCFAMLLKAWHTDLPFNEFCQKVLELYGDDRKYLLTGMRPFIPESDYGFFEHFLEQNEVTSGPGYTSLSGEFSTRYRRTLSETSGYSLTDTDHPQHDDVMNMDEFDKIFKDITAQIETLEASVDTNTSYNSYLT
ncbi:cerebral cavernous malformations protein 2 homolog [Tubulanus polymorphus]|uniref:cerebral cavernous malformations protein 2 homolog n=1 Tax=Tubulanus polymorphus TaxID=672921 RepID=UPI003DA3836B